jgi:predicted RNA binding protein YcfA (HicA-like mRNA interferase family)
MQKIPLLSGSGVVKVFSRLGWDVVRQRGSHIILVSVRIL